MKSLIIFNNCDISIGKMSAIFFTLFTLWMLLKTDFVYGELHVRFVGRLMNSNRLG